jgi:hypothetical protein
MNFLIFFDLIGQRQVFPISLTVDLGQVTKLSTVVMYQHRSADVPFTWVNPKHFVVYGREAAPS